MTTTEKKLNAIAHILLADDPEERHKSRAVLASLMNGKEDPIPTDADGIIQDILMELGAPAHLSGFYYMVDAVKLVISGRDYLRNITGATYGKVAAKYGVAPTQVERSLRHLVETCFNRMPYEVVLKYFGNSIDPYKAKATNSEFIARVAAVAASRMKQ